jgi:hypothetical protein
LTSTGRISSTIDTAGPPSLRAAVPANDGSISAIAPTTLRQKRRGSSSPGSSDTQTNPAPPADAHSASRLVLPHPVGAHTSVSLALLRPSSRAATRRGRETTRDPARGSGTNSFVRAITKELSKSF